MINRILLLLIFLFSHACFPAGMTGAVYAEEDDQVKAAFVRNQNLWIKNGSKEFQITNEERIESPKWSPDGQWIAYKKILDEQTSEIWLYHVKTNTRYAVMKTTHPDYRWAPNKNELAFLAGDLHYVTTAAEHEQGRKNLQVMSGAGHFSWLPDGSGWLVSKDAKPTETGWSDVEIFVVPQTAIEDPHQITTFHSIPSQTEGYFVISTSPFKWSNNQKWIAFLGIPTASLSADANTLFAFSADGERLIKLDDMLNNENWYKWAPKRMKLAYIEGTGRMATLNKKLKVKTFSWWNIKEKQLTPPGYVDKDFTWNNHRQITVSRAKEKEWVEQEVRRPLPVLVQVDVKSERQRIVTTPAIGFGDFAPVYLKGLKVLNWIRTDRLEASVWLANEDGSDSRRWIENIDLGSNYYEMWDWSTVYAVYQPPNTR